MNHEPYSKEDVEAKKNALAEMIDQGQPVSVPIDLTLATVTEEEAGSETMAELRKRYGAIVVNPEL